ncbi:MAG TPA: efflux RND transporter periplasmic adaptor subunit [Candidatus Acidoferrum sp.]|nr:efflux RND transporter periplasmic adaptor subunit [Candidatus Acidoferrum sp.]
MSPSRSFANNHAVGMALLALSIALIPLSSASLAAEDNKGPLKSDASLTVNAGKAETSQFKRYLTVNGTINAWQDVVISPEVGGYRVEAVLVDVGDVVKAGQPLIKLSTALLQADYDSKEAALKQREAELDNYEVSLKRGQAVADKQLLSGADLDRLVSDALGGRSRLDGAKADLEAARVRLQFATIKAPDAGIITSRSVTVGQLAQVGGEMLRMLRQGRVEWRGEVPESSLPSLNIGQPIVITAVDGSEQKGKIRMVSPTVNPSTHNGMVYVDIDASPSLRAGMFARGRIEYTQAEALTIPLTSMVSSDGYNYVFVVDADRKVHRQLIKTGALQGNAIEVIEGIKPGTSIVINGAGFLRDGDLVNVVETR